MAVPRVILQPATFCMVTRKKDENSKKQKQNYPTQ